MAKSAGVLHSNIEISDNILIQESTYSYIDGIQIFQLSIHDA